MREIAMRATVTDCKEAWDRAKLFLDKTDETLLFLKMDSQYSKTGYTIVKLPYGKNVFLLYAFSWHDNMISPGLDMQYAGFYCKTNEQTYDIRDPLTAFFGFDKPYIYEGTLKDMVMEEIQKATAEHIAANAEQFSGIPAMQPDSSAVDDAAKAFSKKEKILDFAKKISISEWSVTKRDMVNFIDDPDPVIQKKVEELVKDRKEELARLWVAHCASQKILDQLYAEYAGNNTNKQGDQA